MQLRRLKLFSTQNLKQAGVVKIFYISVYIGFSVMFYLAKKTNLKTLLESWVTLMSSLFLSSNCLKVIQTPETGCQTQATW